MESPIEVGCPWCGETYSSFFDPMNGGYSYVEDCQVCCRPIVITGHIDEWGNVSFSVERE